MSADGCGNGGHGTVCRESGGRSIGGRETDGREKAADRKAGAIGIFDSGLGGLTVLREIRKLLPEEDIVYFGDSGRTPYGTKSPDTILRYTLQDVNFLLSKNVKAVVIACNTASACGLEAVREKFDIPVTEVVRPGSRAAVRATRTGRIGVIGTSATIGSGVYERAIAHEAGLAGRTDVNYFGKACPLFVSLAEEGWWDGDITYLTAEKYLSDLKRDNIDTLVLGCTHYPLLSDVIGRVMGEAVQLINSASEVALAVKDDLGRRGLLKEHAGGRKEAPEEVKGSSAADSSGCDAYEEVKRSSEADSSSCDASKSAQNGPEIDFCGGQVQFYTSDSVAKFRQLGGKFLGAEIDRVENIKIENY